MLNADRWRKELLDPSKLTAARARQLIEQFKLH
jgi:hypothetical protein